MDEDIRKTIALYMERFPRESAMLNTFVELMDAGASVKSRTEVRGHVTCGAIVLGESNKVLMVHHNVLKKWLFPGGHVEDADQSLRQAAMRELSEETGTPASSLRPFHSWLDVCPIHIDRHVIPANERKQEPEHFHYDFRFVFLGTPGLLRPQEEEVSAVDWVERSFIASPIKERLETLFVN